jgi:hypothetical protein
MKCLAAGYGAGAATQQGSYGMLQQQQQAQAQQQQQQQYGAMGGYPGYGMPLQQQQHSMSGYAAPQDVWRQ